MAIYTIKYCPLALIKVVVAWIIHQKRVLQNILSYSTNEGKIGNLAEEHG